MKSSILIFHLLCCINLSAQHFQVKTEKDNTVKFTNLSGDVSIKGTRNKEISIDYYPDDTKSKTSSGNTAIGLEFQKLNGTVVFTGLLPEARKGRYEIHVPEKILLNYQSDAGYSQQVVVIDCKGDIDINMSKDVTLDNVSGGIVIRTASGKVTVKSPAIHKHKPVSIITETGSIYFAVPANTNADLKLGSATGTVHTSHYSKKGEVRADAKQYNTKLGTGGTQIQIQSLSGDIHFVQF
jgi:hypothetical protein